MLVFLGIGAQKSGTTWLYNALNKHPLINFPKGKEVHFWNGNINSFNVNDYLISFIDPRLVEGEITPAYGHLSKDKIRIIHRYLPDIKIIYIMRNPVDRAWSSALMALNRSELKFEEASDQWFIDHFTSAGSLARGDYEKALKNWTSIYTVDRVLPLFFEDMVVSPYLLIKNVFRFLQVDILDDALIRDWDLHTKVFPGRGNTIRPHLKSFLQSIYREKIINLERYLDIDLSSKWGGWWNEAA